MGRLSDELEKNTKAQKDAYREQYYANHGEYPPEETGCLDGLLILILKPFIWMCKWIFKGMFLICKWMCIGIFLMFKALFYIFPKFLWKKGIVGKILLGVYIVFWGVAIWIQNIGSDIVGQYIVNNWVYGIIVLTSVIVSTILSIIFTKKKGKFINQNTLISISTGLVAIIGVILFGVFISKDLTVIPEHKIRIKNVYAVSISDLNIRIGPSASDEIIELIKANTKIQIFPDEKNGDWIKVKHNDIEGYANSTYLKKE